MLTTIKWGSES